MAAKRTACMKATKLLFGICCPSRQDVITSACTTRLPNWILGTLALIVAVSRKPPIPISRSLLQRLAVTSHTSTRVHQRATHVNHLEFMTTPTCVHPFQHARFCVSVSTSFSFSSCLFNPWFRIHKRTHSPAPTQRSMFERRPRSRTFATPGYAQAGGRHVLQHFHPPCPRYLCHNDGALHGGTRTVPLPLSIGTTVYTHCVYTVVVAASSMSPAAGSAPTYSLAPASPPA